jgi:hypothetical protein
MSNIIRFKITDPSGRTETSRYETIREVVDDLKSNKRDTTFQTYHIEDMADEMEIDSDELLKAWDQGERPEDLQMF